MIWIQKNSNGWFGYHTIGNGTLRSINTQMEILYKCVTKNQKTSLPRETEKNGLRYLTSGGQHQGVPTHGGRNQDGPGGRSFKGVSHPRSGDYRVCDGVCTHTVPHAHFSATVCRTCHPDTLLTRVHTHARLKHVKKVFAVRKSWLSISPSPFWCFTHLLRCFLITSLTPRVSLSYSRNSCRVYPDPKTRVRCNSETVRMTLATWPTCPTPQVMSPSSLTRWFLRMMTRRPSTIQTTTVSVTSQKTKHENTVWFGVPTVWKSIPNRTLSRVETAIYLSKGEGLWKKNKKIGWQQQKQVHVFSDSVLCFSKSSWISTSGVEMERIADRNSDNSFWTLFTESMESQLSSSGILSHD